MTGKWNYLRCSALTRLGGGVRGRVQEDTAFVYTKCFSSWQEPKGKGAETLGSEIESLFLPTPPPPWRSVCGAFDCIWQWKLMDFIFQFIYKLVTFQAAFLFCYTIWLWWMKGGYFCCLVEINNINKGSFIPCITNETKPENRAKARFSSLT